MKCLSVTVAFTTDLHTNTQCVIHWGGRVVREGEGFICVYPLTVKVEERRLGISNRASGYCSTGQTLHMLSPPPGETAHTLSHKIRFA